MNVVINQSYKISTELGKSIIDDRLKRMRELANCKRYHCWSFVTQKLLQLEHIMHVYHKTIFDFPKLGSFQIKLGKKELESNQLRSFCWEIYHVVALFYSHWISLEDTRVNLSREFFYSHFALLHTDSRPNDPPSVIYIFSVFLERNKSIWKTCK